MAGEAEGGSAAEAGDLFGDEREVAIPEGEGSEEQMAAEGDEAAGEDHEGASTRVLPDPGELTASQVEDHRACGHIPYRSWCPECYSGRGIG